MTPRSAQDGADGAVGGSAVPVEGSGAPAGAQGATEADREKAWLVLCALPISIPGYSPETVRRAQDHLAAALAEERERERLQWNPMIGRVIQVAQAWARSPLPIWTDKAAERINRAIEGAE